MSVNTESIDWDNLAKPFPEEDWEWRIQRAGKKKTSDDIWAICVPYITNRAIMNRLDEVATPAKWKNEFKEAPHGGVLCGISILIDGEWVTKWDGAENTAIEKVKGGLSGAMKRAAVQWGMGRHLYELDESFAEVTDKGKLNGSFKDKEKKDHYFKWNPPKLNTKKPVPPSTTAKPVAQPKKEALRQTFTEIMDIQRKRVGSVVFQRILGAEGFLTVEEIQDRGAQETVFKLLEGQEDNPTNKGGK